jgi:hypothetical protein
MQVYEPLFTKGHSLSDKFRQIMHRLINYASDVDTHIKIMCQDLREDFEATREKNEAEIKLLGIDPGPFPDLFSFPDGVANEQFNQETDLYEKRLEQQMDELAEEQREQLELLENEIDVLRRELGGLIEDYPELLFQSLFIAVYSHFERYLINFCNRICESETLSLKPKDLFGNGIRRSQAYLKKVALLNFPDNTKEWQIIILLSGIRNKLVHDPEHEFRREEVDPKLLDYFWLDDPYLDDFDVESIDIMFSIASIRNIVNTFVRFSKDIDNAWEEQNYIRKKFQRGPKHKK